MPVKVLGQDTDHRGYLDLNKHELRNVRLQQLGADIGSPVDGLVFYRTDTNKIRARINGAWQDLATMADVTAGGISSSLVDAKGDLIVGTADNTVARKAAGANGTFLQAQSAQGDGLLWTTVADADLPSTITRDTEVFLLSAYTTKGDIGVATGAGVVARKGVGADNTFLVADSAQATGVAYRALLAADMQEKIATADLTDWPRVTDLDLNGRKITGLADGTAATDGATFGQLNAILEGKKYKLDPAAAATTGALPNTPTYSAGAGTLTAGANAALAAQDTVTLAVGDTLLVKDQASSFQDGIYTVTAVGSGAAPWVLTRRADGNSAAELNAGATIFVTGGSAHKGDTFTQTATLANLTSDTQTWAKTGDANTVYTADGTTIDLTGTQFSLHALGITNAHISASAAIAYSKLNLSASIVNADIAAGAAIAYSKLNLGTSIVNADIAAAAAIAYSKLNLTTSIVNGDIAAGAAIAKTKLAALNVLPADLDTTPAAGTARVARIIEKALTGGSNSEDVTHGFGKQFVQAQFFNNASPFDERGFYWECKDTNTITVYAETGGTLPAGFKVVVTG